MTLSSSRKAQLERLLRSIRKSDKYHDDPRRVRVQLRIKHRLNHTEYGTDWAHHMWANTMWM